MKVWLNDAGENWIVDQLKRQFCATIFPDLQTKGNSDIIAQNPNEATIFWAIADWCLNYQQAKAIKQANKKLLVSVHHVTPWKLTQFEKEQFQQRDAYVDAYHVPCQKTKVQLENLMNVASSKIHVQSFWINPFDFYPMTGSTKEQLKRDWCGLPTDSFIVFSAQRDTEGSSIGPGKTPEPKREKGPDSLVAYLKLLREQQPNLFVVLAGWRRQYVIVELDKLRIPYKMFELPPAYIINQLYNAADLYVCASRVEGGPFSIPESALSCCPIISTDVGLASTMLAPESVGKIDPTYASAEEIAQDLLILKPNVEQAYLKVEKYNIPGGFTWFRDLLKKL